MKRDGITFAGLAGNNIAYPYMRQAGTDTLVYLAPSDWVRGNFLQGMRLGAQGTANNNNSGWVAAPNGAVLTASYQDANYMAVYYKYPQYHMNGTWYNTDAI